MTPLLLLFVLTFLVAVDLRILAPVLPSVSDSLGSTPGIVGLAMTSYTFAYGSGQLFYGPLSDRLGRLAVVRVAGLAFSGLAVLSALAVTAPQFIAVRLVAGLFAGAAIPLTLVYIGDTVPYERRQAMIGRLAATVSGAMAFSAAIGGTVAYLVSWRVMILSYALIALIPVGLMWRLPAPRPTAGVAAGPPALHFADLLRDRRARFVYFAAFLQTALLWGSVTYLGAFAARRHGLDQFSIGLLMALFGVGTVLGGLLMGRLHRLAESVRAGAGGICMAAALLAIVPRWPWPIFAGSLGLLGLGFALLHTTLQLRATEISSTARGKAVSLFAFHNFVGLAVGTALLAPLVDAGYYEGVFVAAGTGLALIGLATAAAPRRRAA
jgi:predicted MFS family arabinose efflux permease